eukprot:m.145012 g.145012  ORF g.145012 m.145012 type:complete len:432 (+) comp16210_c0_seq5:1534-2829(+)
MAETTEMAEEVEFGPESRIVFSGYLTKQGRFRKNWKRRHMELTEDHILRYYKQAGSRKLAGKLDLQDVTVIIPGGQCHTSWISQADPRCCFGIMTKNRRLHCYAETRDDLKMWLEAFACHVKEGVNVTTPQDIIASWTDDVLALYDDQSPEFKEKNFSVRVTVFLNGQRDSGRVIIMPTSMDLLLARCSLLYNVALVKAFSHRGHLLESSREIADNDVVVVAAAGDDFDLESLPLQARHFDDVVDSSSSDEAEEDVEGVLHRLNTEILALEDKPGYKKKRAAAEAAAKGDKIARIANLGGASTGADSSAPLPADVADNRDADNEDEGTDNEDEAAGEYAEPELHPAPAAEHQAGYIDPSAMAQSDNSDVEDNVDNNDNDDNDSSDSSEDEAAPTANDVNDNAPFEGAAPAEEGADDVQASKGLADEEDSKV